MSSPLTSVLDAVELEVYIVIVIDYNIIIFKDRDKLEMSSPDDEERMQCITCLQVFLQAVVCIYIAFWVCNLVRISVANLGGDWFAWLY